MNGFLQSSRIKNEQYIVPAFHEISLQRKISKNDMKEECVKYYGNLGTKYL
jgi:hypothetical protein